MTFGYGTKEFEVTADRLGCYRPEDHIDNPKDYADNEDATQYDRRLRGPVDERAELAIDPKTGLKNYIANEHAGIMTSAKHVRKLFAESIRLGRSYNRSQNKAELYEALRLMGTGLHCLEGKDIAIYLHSGRSLPSQISPLTATTPSSRLLRWASVMFFPMLGAKPRSDCKVSSNQFILLSRGRLVGSTSFTP